MSEYKNKNNAEMMMSIVIPLFNEEGNILPLIKRLIASIKGIDSFENILIDDGSVDNTLNVLRKLSEDFSNIHYISFSQNFGHQPALKAGLDHAKGKFVITMDGDLQHPPEFINDMIDKWKTGYYIVNTIRVEDKNLSYFKKKTSSLFYKIINLLSDIRIVPGADFRLMDRAAVDVFKEFTENPQFIRGLIPWMGFRQVTIPYQQESRLSGKTKYSMRRMFKFAFEGITSFSVKPLYFSFVLGMFSCLIAVSYCTYAILIHFFTHKALLGWTSVLVSILFLGGVQLIMLGIIGEYLGKLFMQVKGRPHYIIKEMDL
jgi:polyisoprenyl-phosphate glycosyltransferase